MSRSFKIKCLDFALNKASLWTFDVFSGHRRIREQVVWAYVEMNTRLLRRAKKQGIPTILDNPIAHMRNYYEVNKAENAALGLPFDDKYNRWWTRQAEQEYALADHLVCGSNFVKETLVAQGVPAEKIYVLHTGVNTTLWNESFEARQNRTASDRFTVIFTGYVGPRKGIRFLVQAWVKANLPNADLFLVGGGSDVFPWNRVVDQLPSSIHLLGARKHAELKDLYGRCDIFVIPSLLEGFVRSGLEAMAAGLPVIYTHETGLDDVIDHGVEGWRVPAHDVDSLCAQFQWCYDHREDVLLAGKRAHEKMMNQSMESYGEQCVNLVRSICEKG